MSSDNWRDGKKLQRVYIEFDDPAKSGLMQYQQENLEGDGLSSVRLPFDLNTFATNYVKMELYEKSTSEPVVVEDLEKLKYLVLGAEVETDNLRDWKRRDPLLDSLLPAYFEQSTEKFPAIQISDVTERDMFGYEGIPESKLGDKGGIWAWHGLRKLEISVKRLEFDEENKAADEEQRAAMYFFRMGKDDLDDLITVEDIRFNRRHNIYVAYLNTNKFGEALENSQDISPIFSGRFELHIYDRRSKVVYSFPVSLCVHDTQLDDELENHLLDEHGVVSIDFGTSSTCAAVMGTGRPELITLSGEGKRNPSGGDNQYENPTNLMIYNWNEFFRQWERANSNCPFLVTKSEEIDDSEADYDSGYTVDDILKEINSDDRGQRRVRAIVTELKTIPAMKLQSRRQLKIYPLNDITGKVVYVTDNFEEEDEDTLDPIAFYGYLLSRAINNPVRQKIYRYYNVTFPVKFNLDVREKICNSLAYGIRRALPLPLATAQDEDEPFISVTMDYEESVACVGAVVANQLVIDEDSPQAKPFAVFDLGGGTLDTSYGIFRKAVGDECDEAEYTIQIFGCGGNERVGGEKLIHQIAYKIYLDNRDETEGKEIPFVLPQGEHYPRGFDGLLTEVGDEISNANVSTLKENIARTLFQCDDPEGVDNRMTELFGDDVAPDANHCYVTLRDKANEEVTVSLEVRDIENFLRDKINGAVIDFKSDMDTICATDKIREALGAAGIDGYNPKDFAIFLGGNASKQHYVEELMHEHFPDSRIERIHSTSNIDEDELSDRYKLNGKTAVAFGQLRLENYYIDKSAYKTGEDERAPFPFNVGYKDSGSGKFVVVLEKNNNSREWSRANLIGTRDYKTNLFFTSSPQLDEETLKPFQRKVKGGRRNNKKVLWIRVAPDAHNSIEYRLGGSNEKFSADEPMDPERVFELSE